jgi:hypothetical protein
MNCMNECMTKVRGSGDPDSLFDLLYLAAFHADDFYVEAAIHEEGKHAGSSH